MAMPNVRAKKWTLAEVHALPEDGNRYELVHGELLVTPAPTPDHQAIVAALARLILPFIIAENVGELHFPRAVIRVGESETEPDLMVRPRSAHRWKDWRDAPTPLLAIEVLSPSSRRGDSITKRGFYREIGIPEYWIADGESRTIRVVRPDGEDVVVRDELEWSPAGATRSLVIDLRSLFDEAVGPV